MNFITIDSFYMYYHKNNNNNFYDNFIYTQY